MDKKIVPATLAQPTDPSQYKRRILFVVTGLSPAVVTETLYALAIARDPAFIPTEVHVLSTGYGARLVTEALFKPQTGAFHAMVAEFPALAEVRFDASHVAVIKNQTGHVLDDITSPQENQDAADMITEAVRRFTLDPDTALHVSMAGGRKTMGFFAGYALSLFGRSQDRLSHVLLQHGIEQDRRFYYPSTQQGAIQLADGSEIPSRDVEVMLAEIPVVRLRHGIPEQLISGNGSYRSVVQAAQAALGAPSVRIDLAERIVYCADRPLKLPPVELAFYAWLAERVLTNGLESSVGRGTDPDEFLEVYRRFAGQMSGEAERIAKGIAVMVHDGTFRDWAREKTSRVNARLKKDLGQELGLTYRIHASGKPGYVRYGLNLRREDIQLDWTPSLP